MPFRSREEVEEIADGDQCGIQRDGRIAADDCDQGTYLALINLHGNVTMHLADRGRQLPRVIAYKYRMVMPALRMAQRAYAEPSRYQELVDENQVVHPAFMPARREDAGHMNDVPSIEHNRVPITPGPLRLYGNKEICTLKVRGQNYTNWTSVRVEQRTTEAFPRFQFECTEESPMPLKPWMLAFVPGDVVQVFIGGSQVVFGYIQERHVGYDATNHGVRLIGVGDTADLVQSMVPVEKLGSHDNKSWAQLFYALTAHLGTKLKTRNIDNTPFEDIQVQPGETIMNVLERYARPRNIVIGSNANGGTLALGEHEAIATGKLQESVDILRANAVVRDNMVYKKYAAVGQNKGSDKAWGAGQNQQIARLTGTSTRPRESVVAMEIADKMHGVQRRVKMEHVFCEGSYIEAQITVQGFYKDSNQSDEIWRAGEYYSVYSPSLILHGEVLGCQSCVYEQNAQGSTTTLTMVKPEHMNGVGLAQGVRGTEEQLQMENRQRAAQAQSGAGT